MNDFHDSGPLERRLRAEAKAFDPPVPENLARRCLKAVSADAARTQTSARHQALWTWVALPLAAGLLLVLLLESWHPQPNGNNRMMVVQVPISPPADAVSEKDLLSLLTVLLPERNGTGTALLDQANGHLESGLDQLYQDSLQMGSFLLRCLPFGPAPAVGI